MKADLPKIKADLRKMKVLKMKAIKPKIKAHILMMKAIRPKMKAV